MPTYKYKCRNCESYFTIKASLKQKEKGLNPQCVKCGGNDVFQTFDSIGIIGSGNKKNKSKTNCGSCSGNLSCCG